MPRLRLPSNRWLTLLAAAAAALLVLQALLLQRLAQVRPALQARLEARSEEHTSELQSH